MTKTKTYAKSILTPIILGTIVGIITSGFMDYTSLRKPVLSPPGIIFPIVWTILYTLMGVSYGILKDNQQVDSDIRCIYYSQLFVNLAWSFIFFVFKCRLLAFLWILLLIVLVVIMTLKFYSKNKIAGLLQIPYIVWILFASYLNLSIYLLNI